MTASTPPHVNEGHRRQVMAAGQVAAMGYVRPGQPHPGNDRGLSLCREWAQPVRTQCAWLGSKLTPAPYDKAQTSEELVVRLKILLGSKEQGGGQSYETI